MAREIKIFYSWQTDLPPAANRHFIEKALRNAVKKIRDDESLTVEPVVDRDTLGEVGAVEIAETILRKIREAGIVVCDVSIIGTGSAPKERPTPNPNVAFEAGYAARSVGWKYIIPVFNTAYGKVDTDLPFDIRGRRVLCYRMPEDQSDRAPVRHELEKDFVEALTPMIKRLESETGEDDDEEDAIPQVQEALEAVATLRGDRDVVAGRFMQWLVEELVEMNPDYKAGGEPDEILVAALADAVALVEHFSAVAETASNNNARNAVLKLYKEFSGLLMHYFQPPGAYVGYKTDFDFYRFIGHELMVTLTSHLIVAGRWELIAEMLSEGIYVNNWYGGPKTSLAPFSYASEHVALLDKRGARPEINHVCFHGKLLRERHESGSLSLAVPFNRFLDAEYLLYLRGEAHNDKGDGMFEWRPWSALFLDRITPRLLVEATSETGAKGLVTATGMKGIDELRQHVEHSKAKLPSLFRRAMFYDPLGDFDSAIIASR